jgi:hypothetical protein
MATKRNDKQDRRVKTPRATSPQASAEQRPEQNAEQEPRDVPSSGEHAGRARAASAPNTDRVEEWDEFRREKEAEREE